MEILCAQIRRTKQTLHSACARSKILAAVLVRVLYSLVPIIVFTEIEIGLQLVRIDTTGKARETALRKTVRDVVKIA